MNISLKSWADDRSFKLWVQSLYKEHCWVILVTVVSVTQSSAPLLFSDAAAGDRRLCLFHLLAVQSDESWVDSDEHFISNFHQLSVDVPGEGCSFCVDEGCGFQVILLFTLILRTATQWAGADLHCWHSMRLHEGEVELSSRAAVSL